MNASHQYSTSESRTQLAEVFTWLRPRKSVDNENDPTRRARKGHHTSCSSGTNTSVRSSRALKQTRTVNRVQLPLTMAYAFTGYQWQGQTISYVIIDIATPPTGTPTLSSLYVALSLPWPRKHPIAEGFRWEIGWWMRKALQDKMIHQVRRVLIHGI